MTEAAESRIHRGRKFEQVLDGARRVFLRDGFDRASVDEIAREAGVSKATIYAYFPDKALMFLEVARDECHRQTAAVQAMEPGEMPVRDALTLIAERIVAFQMSDLGQRMFRIIVGEGARFPGLGREFHAFGPGLVMTRLAAHLQGFVAKGELVIEDAELAAEQFVQLCKAGQQDRLILDGPPAPPSPAAIRRTVQGAVDMFLARYGLAG